MERRLIGWWLLVALALMSACRAYESDDQCDTEESESDRSADEDGDSHAYYDALSRACKFYFDAVPGSALYVSSAEYLLS